MKDVLRSRVNLSNDYTTLIGTPKERIRSLNTDLSRMLAYTHTHTHTVVLKIIAPIRNGAQQRA